MPLQKGRVGRVHPTMLRRMSTAVLIVNYRTYTHLARCLASLMPYLERDDEVVVVDYESDERTLAAAIPSDSRIVQLRRRDNRGFAAGVNLAAAASRAPFLLLLNPDAMLQEPVVRELEAWLAAHPDVGAAGPRVLNEDGTVQPSARRFPDITTALGGRTTWWTKTFPRNWISRRNLIAIDGTTPTDVDWVSGSCLMTRRDVFDRVGGFDEAFFLYWEDADYCRRLASAGFRSTFVPTVTVRHATGQSAEFRLPESIRAFHRSAYLLYMKHAGAFGRLLAPVVRAGLWLRGERAVVRETARRRKAVDR